MQAHAVVVHEAREPIEVVEPDVDEPRAGEVLARHHYAGLCHCDPHVATGTGSTLMEQGGAGRLRRPHRMGRRGQHRRRATRPGRGRGRRRWHRRTIPRGVVELI